MAASPHTPASTSRSTDLGAPCSRDECLYTSCYCEENIYLLTQRLQRHAGGKLFVVVISNPQQKLELWCQRIGAGCHGYAVWDYHVILLQCDRSEAAGSYNCRVWDLDSTLPFPVPFQRYCRQALRHPTVYPRFFRVVSGEAFLRSFASDRSHMLLPNGTYGSVPPPYPPITSQDGESNTLDKYLDMAMDALPSVQGSELRDEIEMAGKFGAVLSEPLFMNLFD